jgi:hypothetical protein
MADNNPATLIRSVCQDVGKLKGIEFHPQATWGMQVPGRWESSYRLRRQGHSTVILSYWFSLDMLLREEAYCHGRSRPHWSRVKNSKATSVLR